MTYHSETDLMISPKETTPSKGPLCLFEYQKRNAVYFARKVLKNSSKSVPVYINEHLTRLNSEIFAKTKGLVKEKPLHSIWTREGLIYISVTDSSEERSTIGYLQSRAWRTSCLRSTDLWTSSFVASYF